MNDVVALLLASLAVALAPAVALRAALRSRSSVAARPTRQRT
jgi:hypothetical protein